MICIDTTTCTVLALQQAPPCTRFQLQEERVGHKLTEPLLYRTLLLLCILSGASEDVL